MDHNACQQITSVAPQTSKLYDYSTRRGCNKHARGQRTKANFRSHFDCTWKKGNKKYSVVYGSVCRCTHLKNNALIIMENSLGLKCSTSPFFTPWHRSLCST